MQVLIVYDVENWAFHHLAKGLAFCAPPGVSVTLCNVEQANQFSAERLLEYGAIYYMSWTSAPIGFLSSCRRVVTLVTSNGPLYETYDPADWNTRIVTGSRNAVKARMRLKHFDAVITVNERLRSGLEKLDVSAALIPQPVDLQMFHPRNRYIRRLRLDDPQYRLKVGWCANKTGDRSVKGYDEVLQPLRKRLGDAVRWEINDRTYRSALTREEMARWYETLDLFLCTSINEGTPSPLFEAAACGVTILSPPVGMVADWPLPQQLGLIVPAYHDEATAAATVEALAEKITVIDRARKDLPDIGEMLYRDISNRYDLNLLAPKYWRVILGAAADEYLGPLSPPPLRHEGQPGAAACHRRVEPPCQCAADRPGFRVVG